MNLTTPYCTVSAANIFLADNEDWPYLSQNEKEKALQIGRLYIDKNYQCVDFDEDDPPEAIQYANALLAEDFIEGKLIIKSGTVVGAIREKYSKAGSVETRTKYNSAKVISDQADVELIISEYCKKNSANKIITRI